MKETYSIAMRGKSGRRYTFNFKANAEHVAVLHHRPAFAAPVIAINATARIARFIAHSS